GLARVRAAASVGVALRLRAAVLGVVEAGLVGVAGLQEAAVAGGLARLARGRLAAVLALAGVAQGRGDAGLDRVVERERLVAALQLSAFAMELVTGGRAAMAGGGLAEGVRRVVGVAQRRALARLAHGVEAGAVL